MKLKLTVDGKVYEVEVDVAEPEQPHPSYVPPANRTSTPPTAGTVPSARPGTAPVADENKVCRSPVSGVIVRLSAQVGQTIQPNDVLMVLEAMKMETEVRAQRSGTVTEVMVKVGDKVAVGDPLISVA